MNSASSPILEALRRRSRTAVDYERRRLIAAAWHAGHRNINELIAASGAARQTIYNDLAAEGIDYRDRDAPVFPPSPLPETAEPSLIGELRAAALSAIGSKANAVREAALAAARIANDAGEVEDQDENPYTAELGIYDLARVLNLGLGNRGSAADSLAAVMTVINNTWDASTAALRARWVAWELRRLGAEADAQRFEQRADDLTEHGNWPPPSWNEPSQAPNTDQSS